MSVDKENLNLDDLEDVSGGIALIAGAAANPGVVKAYCRTCNAKLQYLRQDRVNGGNTGVFKCTNTHYKGPNKKCPRYGKEVYNDQVKFKK